MLQDASLKFSGGCMMLVRKRGGAVVFLGTAFLMHDDGYLLTAAHLIGDDAEDLMVVRAKNPEEFVPISLDEVPAMGVSVSAIDKVHNVALLEIDRNLRIETPDHLVGAAATAQMGSSVINMGFPFGHQELHALAAVSGIISAKVQSRNGTKMLLFDTMVLDGDAGGPLVQAPDGRVIGIVIGRFSPVEDGGDFTRGNRHPGFDTNISYAVAIEYGIALMEAQGLTVI